MSVAQYLARLGYGSRREVERMLSDGRITRRDGQVMRDDSLVSHDEMLFDAAPLDPSPGALIMLHKPTGYVCSTSEATDLIYELLPPRFLLRSPLMAPIGRLDRDTSGLLLLTDDGKLNHRLASPKSQKPKCYEVVLASDLRGDEATLFASGTVMLKGESTSLRPATLEVTGARTASITLTEGRYHQVRRMFAAVGNHVATLHRRSIGELTLDALPPGEWRVIGDRERELLG